MMFRATLIEKRRSIRSVHTLNAAFRRMAEYDLNETLRRLILTASRIESYFYWATRRTNSIVTGYFLDRFHFCTDCAGVSTDYRSAGNAIQCNPIVARLIVICTIVGPTQIIVQTPIMILGSLRSTRFAGKDWYHFLLSFALHIGIAIDMTFSDKLVYISEQRARNLSLYTLRKCPFFSSALFASDNRVASQILHRYVKARLFSETRFCASELRLNRHNCTSRHVITSRAFP